MVRYLMKIIFPHTASSGVWTENFKFFMLHHDVSIGVHNLSFKRLIDKFSVFSSKFFLKISWNFTVLLGENGNHVLLSILETSLTNENSTNISSLSLIVKQFAGQHSLERSKKNFELCTKKLRKAFISKKYFSSFFRTGKFI